MRNDNGILTTEQWLCNGETIAKEVHLGRYDSVENWREITEEEKNAIEAEQDAAKE